MRINVEKMISLARFEEVEIGQVFTTPAYKDFFHENNIFWARSSCC